MKGLKSPTIIAERLSLGSADRVLLVDPPTGLAESLAGKASELGVVEADAIRSIKETFDTILAWRESRVGSRAFLDAVVKRLESGGKLWVVTAMKKVRGLETPSVHRLELSDLVKAFAPQGLRQDREVRLSAWHVAHRFVKR